jgi:hypothetical protein
VRESKQRPGAFPMNIMDTQLQSKEAAWNAGSRKSAVEGTGRAAFFGDKASSTARSLMAMAAASGRLQGLFNGSKQEGH